MAARKESPMVEVRKKKEAELLEWESRSGPVEVKKATPEEIEQRLASRKRCGMFGTVALP